MPVGDEFRLDTLVPLKKLAGDVPEFSLQPGRPIARGKFASVYPEEPYSYMERVKTEFLKRKAGA